MRAFWRRAASDAGDAGAKLHYDQLVRAGVDVSLNVSGFSCLIQDGELDVIVVSGDQHHPDDPNAFTITVGPRGGRERSG